MTTVDLKLNKKYAIMFPGNIASYFLCIEQMKPIIENPNIDIYILYSNKNYCHYKLAGCNKYFTIDDNDIQLIQKTFKNIKYFNNIENIDDYSLYLDNYIQKFHNNIKWINDITDEQMMSFKYIDFFDNNRAIRYLDQFVRIQYLSETILKNHIEYDYIIRLRLDHFYDNNVLLNMFNMLEKTYVPCITNLDCLFSIGKHHFTFFNYLINNIGSYNNNNGSYRLGPEVQFEGMINTFFNKNDVYKLAISITWSFINEITKYTYINKYFNEYRTINNINDTNYIEKFINNQNIIINNHNIKLFEKYKNHLFAVYTIITAS